MYAFCLQLLFLQPTAQAEQEPKSPATEAGLLKNLSVSGAFGIPNLSFNKQEHAYHAKLQYEGTRFNSSLYLAQEFYALNSLGTDSFSSSVNQQQEMAFQGGYKIHYASGGRGVLNLKFDSNSSMFFSSGESTMAVNSANSFFTGVFLGYIAPPTKRLHWESHVGIGSRTFLNIDTGNSLSTEPEDSSILQEMPISMEKSTSFNGSIRVVYQVIPKQVDLTMMSQFQAYQLEQGFFQLESNSSQQTERNLLAKTRLAAAWLGLEKMRLVPNLYIDINSLTLGNDFSQTAFTPIYGIGVRKGKSTFQQ